MSEPFIGHLEQPGSDPIGPEDFLPDGRLVVRGWAVGLEDHRPVEVTARIDEEPRLLMEATGVRDDVFVAHPGLPHAGRSGFVGILAAPAAATQQAPARLHVEVRTAAGWTSLATRRIEAFAAVDGARADDDLLLAPASAAPPRPAAASGALRALLVSHNFHLEGAPRSLLELGGQLRLHGLALRVLGPSAGPLLPHWKRVGATVGLVGDPGRIEDLDDYAQRIRRLATVEARHRPDVLVANTLDAFWAVDLAEALGVPALWIVRESVDVEPYFLGRWPYAIARRALGAFDRAARVSFVSHATEGLYAQRVPADRRGVVWNGLDLARADGILKTTSRAAARRRLKLPPDVPIALCVGTVCQRKGQHVLVDAIAQLAERGAAPVCVLVGARPSQYLEGLEERVRSRGLEGLVRIVPETDDPYLYYRAADLFACPSFEESLPRVVLEAMAFGLPIAATDVYGIPELIDDESGWLVAPGDAAALASAVRAILEDPARAREAGRRARDRAQHDFRIETMGQRYVDLLGELVAGARATAEAG